MHIRTRIAITALAAPCSPHLPSGCPNKPDHLTSMKRDDYLNQACVKSFIDWLRPIVRGETDFHHCYTMRQSRHVPEGYNRRFESESIYEAYNKYVWNRKYLNDNQVDLKDIAKRLRQADEQDDRQAFVKAIGDVLDWGGIFTGRLNDLRERGKQAVPEFRRIFRKARLLLDPSRADTSLLKDVTDMNSGWSKVYSLILDGFPIYDGRVGAAMGYLVRKHCEDENNNLVTVPDLLHFRWGEGQGGHNRDPSSGSLQFEKLSYNSSGKRKWAECNVWTAWILGEVCDEGEFGDLSSNEQMRALEAALFMIGYELPASS